MIDKFNFYDIYGYFVPGAAFLAMLWTPYGLVKRAWPSSDWSSALIAAVIAYIVGHLLQSVATNAIPSWDAKGPTFIERYPSEIYLDRDNGEFPSGVKKKMADFVKPFGLDLHIDRNGEGQASAVDKERHSAFLCARQTLIQAKSAGYAEQFQGMYALTRGLVSVLGLGCAYWLGWAAAALRYSWVTNGAVIVLTLALLSLANLPLFLRRTFTPRIKHLFEVGYAILLLVAFLASGYLLGAHYRPSGTNSAWLVFSAAWALIACFRAHKAYKRFAALFASTVWLDFLVDNVKPQPAVQEK